MKFTSISGSSAWCSARAAAKSPASAASTSRRHPVRHDVGGHGNHAAAADRHQRQRQRIVAAQDLEVRRHAAADLAHLRHVAGRFLDADDVGDRGEPGQRSRLDVAAGAARHVVDDDRQRGPRGNRPVVLEQAFLRRLVVVGRHRQQPLDAERLGCVRELGDLGACRSRRRRRAPGPAAQTSTVIRTTASRSARVSVGVSPVVPQGTTKCTPPSTCRSTSAPNAALVDRAATR